MSTVVVGGGHAGAHLAASLRKAGYAERIVLIGDEPELPYQRPPLSKTVLLGAAGEDTLALRTESFYRDNAIEVLLGEKVAEVDRSRQRVQLASGAELGWDHLVLATGARPRRLDVPGEQLDGVLALRTLADARALRDRMASARSVVVVGGGFIGLEFAAAVAGQGAEVLLLEAAGRLMGRAVTAYVSEFFARAHAAKGVRVQLNAGTAEFLGRNGKVTAVRTSEGRTHPADLVVVGVGVVPNTELAQQTGLAVDGGILVDAALRTTDPRVLAIGDCARFPSIHCGAAPNAVRLESVQNAVDQAVHAAGHIAGGELREYRELPWFWSDQKGLRLQIAGLATGYDHTQVLGEPASGRFSLLAFRDGILAAVESVNGPADHLAARLLLSSGIPLTAAQAAATGFGLKSFAAQATGLAA